MRQTFASLGRLTVISLAALGIATISNFFTYLKYWNGTIFAVQSVDLNILSHTLPTKLSILLTQGNKKEIQRTLNSNYGLFGIVVTDCQKASLECPNQQILYSSKPSFQWTQQLQADNFQNQPYDVLRNPAPVYAEGQYNNISIRERQPTGQTNFGTVIGRVYYIRSRPPTFSEDYFRWIKNPSSFAGNNVIYGLTAVLSVLVGLSIWVVIETILYKKTFREKELALENERKTAEHEKQLALEAGRRLEFEKQLALEANQRLEAENKLLEAENKLARTRGFIGGIQEAIEQDFSSVINNRIQELESIFRRLNTDIDNITHDLRKAPLIRSIEDIPSRTIEKLNRIFYSVPEKESIFYDIAKYLQDADQTIKFINWVIDDLNQVANIESTSVCVQKELENFSRDMPPNLRKDWLLIEFHNQCEEKLWIKNNPWHLRSIVKNVLYNSNAALMEVYEESDYEFEAKISVTCLKVGNEAAIVIEDNGKGFSEQALKKLYQAPNRVNSNAEAYRGRGSIIVFSYLSLHGGRADLTNNTKGGARAAFLFPLAPSPN